MNPTVRELLAEARKIEILTRRDTSESLSGAYHSTFRGSGMEFEEVRAYTPGDDIRSIDWNVTARTGQPFIKRFREERELSVLFAVDISRSQSFGSGDSDKRRLCARIAAVLGLSAVRNNDHIGLLLFDDQPRLFLPPVRGEGHLSRVLLDILEYSKGSGQTDLSAGLNHLNRVWSRRGIVFLLSDFILPDAQEAETRAALAKTHRRHDLVAIAVSDPRESALPNVGWIYLQDAESGEILPVNTADPRVRADFERLASENRDSVRLRLKRLGVDAIHLETDANILAVLRTFFKMRNRRG